MSINNDGYTGVDIEQIAIEKNVLVGVQTPNIKPTIKVDVKGKTLPKAVISPNKGMTLDPVHGFTASYADTSWLSHGGIYSMTSGNKMNFTTGAGGFEFLSVGPLKLNTTFVDYFTTYAFNVKTRLFTVSASKRAQIMGGRIDFNFDDIYFSGNINILNNVAVQGAMFVNGELYCTHMTTMGQKNFTKDSADLTGFINPSQSFVVFEGASVQAPVLSPFITCAISLQLPDPIGELINIPCLIKFPNGISLASDKVLTDTPESMGIISQGSIRTSSNVPSDLIGPGHNHEFIGPSCEYTESTSKTFEEAKKAMESKTPSKSKKTIPNGASSMKQFLQQCEDAVSKRIKDYLVRAKKYVIGIFKS